MTTITFPWTADSSVVTADSPFYTASGYGVPQSSPQFPNVPPFPGVPNLARLPGPVASLAGQLGLPLNVNFGTNSLFAGLGLDPLSAQSQSGATPEQSGVPSAALPAYGITGSDGTTGSILNPDSFIEVEVNADSDVNTHPVEEGGFAAYNRVQAPVSIRMLLACQGINQGRSGFLSALKSLREGIQTVTVSLPDDSYPNMVLKGFGYKKTSARGAVTIWADTQWLEERSTNVSVSPAPTVQPQGAGTSNLGSLTPGDPTTQQQASINNPPVPPALLPSDYAPTAPPSGLAF